MCFLFYRESLQFRLHSPPVVTAVYPERCQSRRLNTFPETEPTGHRQAQVPHQDMLLSSINVDQPDSSWLLHSCTWELLKSLFFVISGQLMCYVSTVRIVTRETHWRYVKRKWSEPVDFFFPLGGFKLCLSWGANLSEMTRYNLTWHHPHAASGRCGLKKIEHKLLRIGHFANETDLIVLCEGN